MKKEMQKIAEAAYDDEMQKLAFNIDFHTKDRKGRMVYNQIQASPGKGFVRQGKTVDAYMKSKILKAGTAAHNRGAAILAKYKAKGKKKKKYLFF